MRSQPVGGHGEVARGVDAGHGGPGEGVHGDQVVVGELEAEAFRQPSAAAQRGLDENALHGISEPSLEKSTWTHFNVRG